MKKQTWAEDRKLKINLEWPYHWDFVGYICSLVTTYVPSKCSNIIMSYTRQECTKTLFNIDMLLHQIVDYSCSLAVLTNVHANTHTLCSWKIHLSGPEGTLYDGEHFVLQFKFNSKYPFDSPQV